MLLLHLHPHLIRHWHLHAGLCGSSLHVWYKALFQELLQQWSRHATAVVALHKARQGPLQQEGADAALAQLKQCGKAFAGMLTLNKVHLKRIQVQCLCCVTGLGIVLCFWQSQGTSLSHYDIATGSGAAHIVLRGHMSSA